MTKKSKSKKMNFMIKYEIIDAMEKLIPAMLRVADHASIANKLMVMNDTGKSFAEIADWSPAEDWSDWADATR